MLDSRDRSFNIVLIGFISTGKTSVGKELHKSLNRKFMDSDKLIEERVNKSIPEIVERQGMKYFRQLEKEVIKELSQMENIIISSGGGVPLDPENIRNLRKKGKIILLQGDAKTVLERTKNIENRPLLKGKNKLDKIQNLMDQRENQYIEAADIVVNTSGKELKAIRDEILVSLNL